MRMLIGQVRLRKSNPGRRTLGKKRKTRQANITSRKKLKGQKELVKI